MIRAVVAALLACGPLTLPCQAAFATYGDWAALEPAQRALYIAGAFDQLTSIIAPDAASSGTAPAARYRDCVARARMTDADLAEAVWMFATGRADLQSLPVPVALMQYLAVTCGSL